MPFFSEFTDAVAVADDDIIVGARPPYTDSTYNIKITALLLLDYMQNNLDFGPGGSGVDTANSPNTGEFAKFTDADTIEGRTAAETRSDLSLVIGTNVQAWSANLDEYAAVNPTAAGLALLDDADAAAQLITLGVSSTAAELNVLDGITSTVTELNYTDGVTSAIQTQLDAKQPLDSDLTTIAGLTATTNNIIQSVSSAWASRTPTQVTATLIDMVGDSGSGGTKGLVPAPASGDTAAGKFLKADGTWDVPAGGGGGSVDTANSPNANEFARFTDSNTIEGRTAAETRADLDLEVGTDLQAYSANLDEYAAVNPTAAGLALLDDADAAAQLVTLGLTATAAELNVLDGATLTVTELNYVDGVTSAIQTQIDGKQASDSGLTALAAFNTNGLLTQTANNTFAGRTLTGTANQITATNGDGVSGNPTLSIPTAFTLPGNMQLVEGGSIQLDAASSADGVYCGITRTGTAGATLAFGDLVYLAAADSRWELADADAASTAGDVLLGICVLAAAADGDPTVILHWGVVRADAAFPTFTISAPVYVGTTAGDVQTAQPTGTDDVIRIVGHGYTADELFFRPSNDYMTHT